MISKEVNPEEEKDSRGRRNLWERIRTKFHERVYGKIEVAKEGPKTIEEEVRKPVPNIGVTPKSEYRRNA